MLQAAISQSGNLLTLYEMMFNNLVGPTLLPNMLQTFPN